LGPSQGKGSRGSPGDRAAPLLERERELEILDHAMDRVVDGVGSLLLVEGPAGIGKTRLLAEAIRLARRRELVVRAARGGELERELPFGIARQLLEPVIERAGEEERSRLLSGSAGLALTVLGLGDAETGSATDPYAPVHGLYWVLANLADANPVLLAIDDGHWADAETLRFLDYLSRRLADLRVVVVVGARRGEPDEPAGLARLRLEAELLHPGPLSTPAVRELIAANLGSDPTSSFADACARATAGNPFLLVEVLRALRADAIDPEDAAVTVADLGPDTVARHVLTRLARFGAEAISLARAIAVLGGSPQLRHAARLSRLGQGRARELCDRLREAEILAPGFPIDFVHPLVRAAIYRDLPEEARSDAHRRAAEQLRHEGATAGEIAPHLLACTPNGDQWVVAELRRAAREGLASGAPDSARACLERALKEPSDEEFPILYELGRVLRTIEPAAAPTVLSRVVDAAPDPELRRLATLELAGAYFDAGNPMESVRWHGEAIESLRTNDPDRALALEAQRFCIAGVIAGRDPASSRILRELATPVVGNRRGERLVRQALSWDLFMACDPVDTVVELALSFPDAPYDPNEIAVPTATYVLSWSGRWAEPHRYMSSAAEEVRRAGLLVNASYAYGHLAHVDLHAGRLARAESAARTSWSIAAELSPFAVWIALTKLLDTLIARGELDEAKAVASGLDLSGGPAELPTVPYPIEVRGSMRLAEGDLEHGVEDLLTFGDEAERRGYLNPGFSAWRQQAGPALAALDRTEEGEALIHEAETRARRFGAAHVIGTVLRSRARLEPRKHQIETLSESVAALSSYGPPHELARSLLELGAAIRRDGRRSDAREPLHRALELAHGCGAGGTEARAREELAAAGSRPRSAFRTGVAALTASELRTARLAADGFNNREIAERLFVTRSTVETHLTHAYQKLGITKRDELDTALAGDRALAE